MKHKQAETMSDKKNLSISPALWSVIVLLGLITLAAGTATCRADQVSATLRQDGQQLLLEVALAPPVPANLIARITVSSPVDIISTSPRASKIDQNKSTSTWLVKNPRNKNLRFTVKTKTPVDLSSVSAAVMYRQSGPGKMITVSAQKR